MQEPNYSEWKQKQLWTLIEAACLLSGIEPLPPITFYKVIEAGGIQVKIYTDLKDAIDLKQIYFAESRNWYLHGRRVKPDECVTWAAGRGYVIPSGLSELMKRDPNEPHEQRTERLKRRVAEEKSKGNKAFNKTVAKEEGISDSRLKQIIGPVNKAPAKKTSSTNWASTLASPASKTTPSKRGSKY